MPFVPDIYPLGDHAITIGFGNIIDEAVNQHCLSIAAMLRALDIPGVKDIIPSYCTVSLVYDPVAIPRASNSISPYHSITAEAARAIKAYQPGPSHPAVKKKVPVCFDLSLAFDLERMAAEKKSTPGNIINIFLNRTYRVYMLGFLPGFAYMGKVDDSIATPRKEKPHAEVKPGSIGIAGSQAGIYPLTSPGGWNIIGRTPFKLFDKDSDMPCLLEAGDEVLFQQITIGEFNQLNQNH